MARVESGAMAQTFFDIVGFSEILMFRRKILGLLLLVQVGVLNLIRKSLNLPPLLYRCQDASGGVRLIKHEHIAFPIGFGRDLQNVVSAL